MATGYEFGKRLGEHLQENLIRDICSPVFHISRSQHRGIMEILGVKTNSGKKSFNSYIIYLDNGFKVD